MKNHLFLKYKKKIFENIDSLFFILLFLFQILIFISYKSDLGGDTGQYLTFSRNFADYFNNLIQGNITLNRFPGYIVFIKFFKTDLLNNTLIFIKIFQLLIFNLCIVHLLKTIKLKNNIFLVFIFLSPIAIYSQKLIYPDGLIYSLLILMFSFYLRNQIKITFLIALTLTFIKVVFWFLIPLVLFNKNNKKNIFIKILVIPMISFILIFLVNPGKLVNIVIERPGYINDIYSENYNRENYLNFKINIDHICNSNYGDLNFIDTYNKKLNFFKSDGKNKNGYSLSSEQIIHENYLIKRCLASKKKKFQRYIFFRSMDENFLFQSWYILKTFAHSFVGWNLNDHLSYQMQINTMKFDEISIFFSKKITNKYDKVISILLIIFFIHLIFKKKINFKKIFNIEFFFLINYSLTLTLAAQHPQDRYMLINSLFFYFLIKRIKKD